MVRTLWRSLGLEGKRVGVRRLLRRTARRCPRTTHDGPWLVRSLLALAETQDIPAQPDHVAGAQRRGLGDAHFVQVGAARGAVVHEQVVVALLDDAEVQALDAVVAEQTDVARLGPPGRRLGLGENQL